MNDAAFAKLTLLVDAIYFPQMTVLIRFSSYCRKCIRILLWLFRSSLILSLRWPFSISRLFLSNFSRSFFFFDLLLNFFDLFFIHHQNFLEDKFFREELTNIVLHLIDHLYSFT